MIFVVFTRHQNIAPVHRPVFLRIYAYLVMPFRHSHSHCIMKLTRLLFVSMLFALAAPVQAQVTKVTGTIFDSETHEPLPFVAVTFRNTRTSVNSDVEGHYSISTALPVDSLVFTYIAYIRQAIKVTQNTTQNVNIYLKPDTRILDSVVIVPGENPAHPILRKVIKNKDFNNKDKLDAYQYQVYNKIEFDLKDIPGDVKDNKMLKSVQFIFDYIDSSNVNKGEKPSLPLLLSEAVSDFYFKKDPKFKKEVIKASRISGVEDKSISQFMGEMYLSVNIYKNNVLVFDKNFVSPVSDNALFYYKLQVLPDRQHVRGQPLVLPAYVQA
jgi:hypothetical protein